MFTKSLVAAAVLAFLPLSAGAQAFVDASDVDTISAMVQDEGYRAVIGTDGVGDPMVTSAANG